MHLERIHPHWSCHWLMLYSNEEFVAKGKVVEITGTDWRAEGPWPVNPGMRLTIWVWPPDKPEGIHVGEAVVLWVNGYTFGIHVQDMDSMDQEWVTHFPDQALDCWYAPRAA